MNQVHQDDIAQIVRNVVERYKQFMKIESFPKYVLELSPADNALDSADEKDFGRIASASYDVRNDQHYLTITEGTDHLDYLLFHEFTHILDDEKFIANVEKSRQSITYMGMHGYEEYHASQIELMKLLRADHVDDSISFSMNDKIHLYDGDKTIGQYLMSSKRSIIGTCKSA